MAKEFAVVTFTSDGNDGEEIISEVPSIWLSSDLTECWWASVKNINTYIAKKMRPVPNDPKLSLFILLNFINIMVIYMLPLNLLLFFMKIM